MNILKETKTLFLVTIFILISITGSAQTPVYQNYTVADGLPSQTVYSLIQDRKGFIWISTDAGVSRFDGSSFTNFTTNDGLTDNEVFNIFEDSKGRLWFTTFNGTLCYYFNGKFFNAGNDSLLKKIKATGPLRSIYEDSKKNIWFGTSNSGISSITATGEVHTISFPDSLIQGQSVYFYEPGEEDFYIVIGGRFYLFKNESFHEVDLLPASSFYDLGFYNISRGKAIYISDRGLELISGKRANLIPGTINPELLKGTVTIYYNNNNENIWITNREKGAILFRKNSVGNYMVASSFLKEKKIIRVYCDNENNTWLLSAGNGIFRLSSLNFNLKSFTAEDGLEQSPANCIKIDKEKNIWVGYNNGFLSCIERSGKIKKFDCTLNIKRYIRVVGIETEQNDIWVGTDNGVVYLTAPLQNNFTQSKFIPMEDNFVDFSFKGFALDHKNNLTITYSHGVDKLNKENSKWFFSNYNNALAYDRTYTHFFDHADNLWISTIKGLCLLKNDSLIYYLLPDNSPVPRLSYIAESADSVLLLGTYGFGVLFFKNGKAINQITEAGGLAGNICKKIVIRNDTVYVASIGGMCRFIYKNNTISSLRNFSVSDGLLSNDVNDIDLSNETIYIATSRGVSLLPVNLPDVKTAPPSVYINLFKVNGQPADTMRKINLSYQNQYLQFNFIAPVYDRPENVIYSYNLRGAGNEWTETKNTSVEFSSLRPGNYSFNVKARKDNSAWSEVATLKFYIAPPYWQTAWFRLIMIAGFLFVIYLIIHFRIARIRKAADEKTELNRKMAGLEMKALRAQMNPHFTFNVMNSIQNYIVNNDITSALRYLSKFAKLIRMTLDNSQLPVVKLSEELSALEIYMELEKMRFKEKLEYEIITGSDIDTTSVLIPSMLLQPYVENAIKHGIMHKEENGKVSVVITKNKNSICCVIEDNGVGRKKAVELQNAHDENNHNPLGSQIAQHRVEAYNIANNSNIQVAMEDINNEQNNLTGMRVIINIPIG